jgi:tRNA dimethylallyltransferase
MNKFIISIVGPTGIGKTDLSLKLASHFQTEIISADSRQFFKEIPIGTAAPSNEELSLIPHHFIHHKSIREAYSVGHYEKEVLDCIEKLHQKHDVLILIGGSGLYIKSVLEGLDAFPKVDPKIREQLNLSLKTDGIMALQKELKAKDPETYAKIDLKNSHRIIRVLEICKGTGKPYSQFLNKDKIKRSFASISIGLDATREIVYERINKRVDQMLKKGLIEEAKAVYKYKGMNALNTVGYKELFEHFAGNCTLDFAVEEIKKNSRRFAKRQLTWFKKNKNTQWYDYQTPFETILSQIETEISKLSNH